ncbi:hypothetical protein GH714_019293 [Hevea brasiliensis]|uniref:Uncharacterized protein n=1 Tax=Hevea brasiliensis TaxID=3981 RepID=A0A6A6L404_HEVBR|nr:hypothetical protein GH714_019293 [Hevea brasiliensis]
MVMLRAKFLLHTGPWRIWLKGDAFKALFRGNAHNRLETYCKTEEVLMDVLIWGIAAQNRVVSWMVPSTDFIRHLSRGKDALRKFHFDYQYRYN